MRIAVLAYRGNMKSGGQGVYLHGLTRALAARGHQIDVFVGPPYPDPMPWADVCEIENQQFWGARFRKEPGAFLPRPDPFRILHPLNFYEYAVSRFGFLPEMFAFSLRAAREVIARMRQGVRYDLVHDVQSVSYGLLWLQAMGLPVVTTIHHPLTVDRRSSLLRDRSFADFKGTLTFYPIRTQARVARRLDAVITSSEISVTEIRKGFAVPPERIHNLANGVRLPPAGKPRTRPNPPELLFVGRGADPNKGLEHLLAAMTLLPNEIRLRVLDQKPESGELKQLANEPSLRGRLRFDGKVPEPELDAAYASATLVVVPSLFEGFGLPAVEGLAAGTPVVATRAGALPEVLSVAKAGRLCSVGDPAGLAKAINELLDNWPSAHRAALDSRARIEASYSWSSVAARTEALYKTLL